MHTKDVSDLDKEDTEQEDLNQSVPPGAPDRTPLKDPDENQSPINDPAPPFKKKPRLQE